MKTSIAEEMARIEETMRSLDAEKSSYRDLMQQAEAEVINFEQAWREGGLHRKRELQNALFPEGLTWWIKRKVFETGKGLSIDDIGTVFDTLGLVGVPTTDDFEHLAATITEATPLYELCASVLEA